MNKSETELFNTVPDSHCLRPWGRNEHRKRLGSIFYFILFLRYYWALTGNHTPVVLKENQQ